MAWWNKPKNTAPAVVDTAQITKDIVKDVASALSKMEVNGLSDQQIRSRMGSVISGGYDFADTMHQIFLDFGYPQDLTFFNFWNMYRRLGIAKNVVELPVDTGWEKPPTIVAPEAFVAEVDQMNDAHQLWGRLKALDKRQRVGRYAGMFMRVRDGLSPEQPIAARLPGMGSLVAMVPIYEGQLAVSSTETDPKSDNFGLPTMYQFSSTATGGRNEKAGASFQIHPDRIIIASEDADNGGIIGVSALEAPYNSLMDIRKVIGGSGEGFYRNAAQSLIHNIKDAEIASSQVGGKLLEELNEQSEDFIQNRMRRSLLTPGLESKVLESNLVSPEHHFKVSLNDVTAATKIPGALLIGNQTGRLASDQDSKAYRSGIESRQNSFGTSMVRANLDWCIRWGILQTAKYSVEWHDFLAPGEGEKLDNATKMATVNKSQFDSGGERPFTGEEIRIAGGFEAESEFDEETDGEDMEGDDEIDAMG